MDYPRLSICFMFILNFPVSLATPQSEFRFSHCSTSGNYTYNSTYATNLKALLSSIPTSPNLDSDGFFNSSFGRNLNQVYAIGLCAGYHTLASCHSCLNNSVQAITQDCPTQKEASRGYDYCMLRFSNRNILGSVDDGFVYVTRNETNRTAQFNDVLGSLLSGLRRRALVDGERKYAQEMTCYKDYRKTYAMEQCTPDISKLDCGKCLDLATKDIFSYCSGLYSCFYVRYSCVIRFEPYGPYLFYTVDARPPPPLVAPPPPILLQSPPPVSTNTPDMHDVPLSCLNYSITVITIKCYVSRNA
ncbi:hypothetical protein RJ639_042773 [Escallonia herrerae]|uniref:Gnk2-homologous domain-containing protein n=1 Tax=Escallonia herrerae TaxID=1293975 RepID=A0AA88WC37_9ASTE|nr:hypothetical protein RJ639_042773 [Escallonia herrerae]